MTDALRAMLYTFHEDLARRRCDMPRLLNDRATRHLVTMVSQLAERSGDYGTRIAEISKRAGTA
jgi:ribosomal protein L17